MARFLVLAALLLGGFLLLRGGSESGDLPPLVPTGVTPGMYDRADAPDGAAAGAATESRTASAAESRTMSAAPTGSSAGPVASVASAPVGSSSPARVPAASPEAGPRRADGRFSNEPEGFDVVIEEDWETFDTYGWWHTPTNQGTTEIRGGRLVWTYPAGKVGGSVPGAKVALDSRRHGPYQYHRDEGVTLSENFHGHRSSVNKFRYFTDSSAQGNSYVGFFGSDDGPLTIGVNSQWGGPHHDTRMRWNSEANRAAPTRSEATFTRGVPHTVETLLYIGTPGNLDGWFKLWLDGALILHYEDLSGIPEGKNATIKAIHFAPVWGGTRDTVPATQTLSVDYSYVSSGAGGA